MNKIIIRIVGLTLSIATLITFAIFQRDNIYIWLGAVYILMSYLSEDYKGSIVRSTIELIIIELVIGLGAYLANFNLITAIFITLIMCFAIYYRYSYYTKKPQYLGFIITYVMLVFSPITAAKLPDRLLSLIFVAIVINIIYFLMNKKDFIEEIDLAINNEIENCNKLLELAIENKIDSNGLEKDIIKSLKDIEIRLYRVLEKAEFYESDIKLRVIVINFIGGLINIIKNDEIHNNKVAINDIKNILKHLNKFNDNNLKNIPCIEVKSSLENEEKKHVNYEIDEYINWFNKSIKKVLDESNTYLNEKLGIILILRKYSQKYKLILEKGCKFSSIKFNTAIRYSGLMAIGMLIVKGFNINHGAWLLTTITVVGLPYTEEANRKAIDRVKGTCVGIIVFLCITCVTTNAIVIIVITIVSVYFSTRKLSYNIKCIFVTLSALCPTTLIYPNESFIINSEYRIALVLLGTVGAMIFNNILFPYSITESISKTLDVYKELVYDTIELFEKDIPSEEIYPIANELLLINKYLWTRLSYNNNYVRNNDISVMLSEELSFTMSISLLLMEKERFNNNKNFIRKTCISFRKSFDNNILKEDFYNEFNKIHSIEEKLLLINIYRICTQANRIKEIEI